MADLGGTYDANAKENNESSVVPLGEYRMVVVKSEKKQTKAGDGEYLNCECKIATGEYQNRTVFQKFNLWNKNADAVKISRAQFSELCRAVGVLTPKDSSELHNKPFVGRVVVKDTKDYGKQNEIKSYKPVQLQPAPTEPAATAAQQPAGNPW